MFSVPNRGIRASAPNVGRIRQVPEATSAGRVPSAGTPSSGLLAHEVTLRQPYPPSLLRGTIPILGAPAHPLQSDDHPGVPRQVSGRGPGIRSQAYIDHAIESVIDSILSSPENVSPVLRSMLAEPKKREELRHRFYMWARNSSELVDWQSRIVAFHEMHRKQFSLSGTVLLSLDKITFEEVRLDMMSEQTVNELKISIISEVLLAILGALLLTLPTAATSALDAALKNQGAAAMSSLWELALAWIAGNTDTVVKSLVALQGGGILGPLLTGALSGLEAEAIAFVLVQVAIQIGLTMWGAPVWIIKLAWAMGALVAIVRKFTLLVDSGADTNTPPAPIDALPPPLPKQEPDPWVKYLQDHEAWVERRRRRREWGGGRMPLPPGIEDDPNDPEPQLPGGAGPDLDGDRPPSGEPSTADEGGRVTI